jgi:hypothetical protein
MYGRGGALLLLALGGIARAAVVPATPAPVDGGASDAAVDPLVRLRTGLAQCAPGDPFEACVNGLRGAQLDVVREGGRVVIALGAPFVAVALDSRDGQRVVDVVFRGLRVAAGERADVAAYLETHAGAFPFSEGCAANATFCGVFYPKQAGHNPAIEVGIGLIKLHGKPVWRKPPLVMLGGHTVYAPDERLLDLRRTEAEGFVVQFSLPLDRDGKPATTRPLLRPAFDAFLHAPFLRAR